MAIKTINDTHLTSIANAIRNKYIESGVDIMGGNGEAPKYKPSEMATAISNLPKGSEIVITALNVTENGTYTAPTGVNGYSPVTVNVPTGGGAGIPSEALTISGDCGYKFYGDNWNWFIENYGSQVTTNNITNANFLFYSSNQLIEIPFTINLSTNGSGGTNMFNGCYNLTNIPDISGKITDLRRIFASCRKIRSIPDSWSNLDFSYFTIQKYTDISGVFDECYSLRQIPAGFISKLHNDVTASTSSKFYYSSFRSCCSLDEVLNIPVDTVTIKRNMFTDTFNSCFRLKNMTFATDNGVPYIANWKEQTIGLNLYVGYVSNTSYILNYNSGITADKEVKDDTTYQTLKDDPDWWTTDIAYSRYNHDSAVATINSLPDTSAYLAANGGTNTIKFNSSSGSATDGGAINTLTEEEIAVAAAKGWTVTLV